MYVTVAGQPFSVTPESILQGQRRRRKPIQNCIIWPILNARESRMGSRLAGAIATQNKIEILFEKEKGLVGRLVTVSVTVAKLSKAMSG